MTDIEKTLARRGKLVVVERKPFFRAALYADGDCVSVFSKSRDQALRMLERATQGYVQTAHAHMEFIQTLHVKGRGTVLVVDIPDPRKVNIFSLLGSEVSAFGRRWRVRDIEYSTGKEYWFIVRPVSNP